MITRELKTPAPDPLALLKGFGSLRRLAAMYPAGHPMISQKLADLDTIVHGHLEMHDELRIDVIHRSVYVNGASYTAERTGDVQMLETLSEIGIESIHITDGINVDELVAVADMLREIDAGHGVASFERALTDRNVRHISLGRLVPLDTRAPAQEWPSAPTGPLDPDYAESLVLAQQAFEQAASDRRLDPVTVRDLIHLLIYRVARSHVALAHILAIKHYENLTYCHSVNVAILTLMLASKLGFNEQTTIGLVEAAVLHDIGKTRIPLEVLKKPGALDKRERRTMEAHTVLGAEILVQMEGLRALTSVVALEHHRGVNGTGYPDLGDGVVPHPASQLVAVADVYEALTGARSYQAPLAPERACLVLARLAGDKLNTAFVKAFVGAITFFPIGSVVRTSLNETGIVVRTNPADPLHPVVALVDDDDLDGAFEQLDTSTRDASGAYTRHIVETLPARQRDLDMSRFLEGAPHEEAHEESPSLSV